MKVPRSRSREHRPQRAGWILLAAMAGLFLPVGLAGADADDIPGPVKVLLFQAQELQKEERFQEAAMLIQDHLESHPEHDGFLPRYSLGVSLNRAERYSEAVEHLETAVRMNPDHHASWLALGSTCHQLERYTRAGEAFLTGFRTAPAPDPLALYYSGISFLYAEDFRRSFETLSELVSGSHGPPVREWYRGYVAAAVGAGRTRECKKVLRDLIARDPGNLESWRLLYQAAGGMEDYRQAAVALTVIDYLRPLNPQELGRLADLYLTLEIPARSTVYYERALREDATPALRERLASAYIASHDRKKARTYLNQAVREAPTPRLWALLGDLNYADQEYGAALEAYRACSKVDPNPARAHLMMAYCAGELDRPGDARRHLLKAMEFEETREPARRMLRSLGKLPR